MTVDWKELAVPSIVALSIWCIILTGTRYVHAKYSRSRTINKLTLKPFVCILVFLTFSILRQLILLFYPKIEYSARGLLLRGVISLKNLMAILAVSYQLLEWTCLLTMVRFQAREENKNRLRVTLAEYWNKEKMI